MIFFVLGLELGVLVGFGIVSLMIDKIEKEKK